MARLVYLITHPEVTIDPAVPIPEWPLSDRGRARMEQMLAQPWVGGIGAIYCSTEQKAIDGAEILARHLSQGAKMVAELGEIDRSATGYLPPDEHRLTADHFFQYPDRSIRGWETAADAQRRIVAAVEALVGAERRPGDIAIVSHGAVGALLLCHLKGVPISREEEQPGTGGGGYFCFEADSRRLVHGWKRIDDAADPDLEQPTQRGGRPGAGRQEG